MRQAIELLRPADITVTASFGVSTLTQTGDDFTQMLSRADEAAYQAKDNGRNRVEVAD
ncbi:MAG: hypothetical protein COC05_04590 [Gammaproteobacteria bacterium]|nr:diguanylate cyclase [bacterium AH-315-E07]PCH60369.1 MAG: hypothetical protein COC05_04590 [Gammaproteobacteria bacterium]